MSLVIDPQSGDPIHHPKRRDVFEFDEQVSQIFENMAIRSIPMYAEMHKLFASFVIYDYSKQAVATYPQKYRILDAGASTGVATKMLWHILGLEYSESYGYMDISSLDTSVPMLDKIKETFPWMNCINTDLRQFLDPNVLGMKFNIIYAAYTLQFTGGTAEQIFLLRRIADALATGGYFLLSHKESSKSEGCAFDKFIKDQYYGWRMDNGYTIDEINSKTEALKDSMWTISRRDMEAYLRQLFSRIVPVTRWGSFSSYICQK